MSEQYAGRQIVGMDLHRRRSVLVRMTDMGERLETVRISNDPEYLAQVMARAGEAPEVVLEAAYGWYWAADTLAELGATVHLAHPLGGRIHTVSATPSRGGVRVGPTRASTRGAAAVLADDAGRRRPGRRGRNGRRVEGRGVAVVP